MPTLTPDVIRGEIVRLAHLGKDLHDFSRDATRALRKAVPFDGVAVVAFDPATVLPVDKWIDNSITGSEGARLAEIEMHEPDVNKLADIAASAKRAASMSEATGGKLDRSRRYAELFRPSGFGDELRAACVADSNTWGAIVLHRERGTRNFNQQEVELLAAVSTAFAEALQRVSVEAGLTAGNHAGEPGLLLLDHDDGIALANDAARTWLDGLRSTGRPLPLVVSAVADRARAIAAGRRERPATARVRTATGHWLVVRGSVLHNGADTRTAVTLQPARTPELADLIAHAYGLTDRERRVTELIAQGLTTAEISARLYLSAYTVQDHLKAIFEKLGVSTRGALVAKLFVDHYYLGGELNDPRRSGHAKTS